MNFTREPIIETVITPREGMKLLVRNSKGGGEEFAVDAVEVVSFGASLFFRSQERPRSFLAPVSDYEIIEQKEVRVPLKTASVDRSIKIGGGREMKPHKEQNIDEIPSPVDMQPPQQENRAPQEQRNSERKNKRRRGRRGRHEQGHGGHEMHENVSQQAPLMDAPLEEKTFSSGAVEEEKAPSFISKLFPPPPTLIKETLSRYKSMEPSLPIAGEDDFVLEEKFEIEEVMDLPDMMEGPEEEN